MANMRLSTAIRNELADEFGERIDAAGTPGRLTIYTGPQPGDAMTAIIDQVMLGQLTFSHPAAPASNNGVLSFSPIAEESSAAASGKAVWARVTDGAGGTVFDCDVSAIGGGATLELNTADIVAGGPIRISTFTIMIPAG